MRKLCDGVLGEGEWFISVDRFLFGFRIGLRSSVGKGGSFGSGEGYLGLDCDSMSHIADDDEVGLQEEVKSATLTEEADPIGRQDTNGDAGSVDGSWRVIGS